MTDTPQRFYIPTGSKLIESFRAFRSYLEKVVAARGETLDPAWYQDGPDKAPQLYKDQPEVLAAFERDRSKNPQPE